MCCRLTKGIVRGKFRKKKRGSLGSMVAKRLSDCRMQLFPGYSMFPPVEALKLQSGPAGSCRAHQLRAQTVAECVDACHRWLAHPLFIAPSCSRKASGF